MRSAPAQAWFALWLLCAATPAGAVEASTVAAAPSPANALDGRRAQLGAAMEAAARAEADRRRAEGDLEALRADRVRLTAALIDTTARVRDAEARSTALEARLDLLAGSEDAIRRSLASRREAIGQVLAALQRMGLHPPPALLASPDDALRAIRTSMLLGAVVPELREAAEDLASDLAELGRLRSEAAGQRDALTAETATLGAERGRLADLVDARRSDQAAAEGTLAAERRRAADLAREATSLKDLVSRLEPGDAVAARDPARLGPSMPFGDARGRLTPPVAGRMIRDFGAADAYGGQERGPSIEARPGAVVSAPADGWVSFAGPYRSYGQLVILTMGDGYNVVLAGLGRVDVVPGQFVLTGEPLGAMGDGSVKTAAAIALGAAQPVLYVEFRKDGAAIDPSPWWAEAELEKVRG